MCEVIAKEGYNGEYKKYYVYTFIKFLDTEAIKEMNKENCITKFINKYSPKSGIEKEIVNDIGVDKLKEVFKSLNINIKI